MMKGRACSVFHIRNDTEFNDCFFVVPNDQDYESDGRILKGRIHLKGEDGVEFVSIKLPQDDLFYLGEILMEEGYDLSLEEEYDG